MFDKYSFIDMFGPIYGNSWYSPEIQDGLTFRWSMSAAQSTLKLPAFNALKLRVRFVLAFHPQDHQLSELVIDIDDTPLDLCWAVHGPYCVLWADVRLPVRRSTVFCALSVPPLIVTHHSDETRALGLAVNKIEIYVLKDEGVNAADLVAAS